MIAYELIIAVVISDAGALLTPASAGGSAAISGAALAARIGKVLAKIERFVPKRVVNALKNSEPLHNVLAKIYRKFGYDVKVPRSVRNVAKHSKTGCFVPDTVVANYTVASAARTLASSDEQEKALSAGVSTENFLILVGFSLIATMMLGISAKGSQKKPLEEWEKILKEASSKNLGIS